MKRYKRGPAYLFTLIMMLSCNATMAGCTSGDGEQSELRSSIVDERGLIMDESTAVEITEIPEGGRLEYKAPDAESRGKVTISVPEWYEQSESEELFEATNGITVKLPTTAIDMGDAGLCLRIVVDDSGYLDWWCGGSVSGYIESSTKADYSSSSWPINVDGREGTVLVQGSADAGGEISGDAFVILDGVTVWFNALPRDGKVLDADSYSRFFRSKEMCNLFDSITLSEQ